MPPLASIPAIVFWLGLIVYNFSVYMNYTPKEQLIAWLVQITLLPLFFLWVFKPEKDTSMEDLEKEIKEDMITNEYLYMHDLARKIDAERDTQWGED